MSSLNKFLLEFTEAFGSFELPEWSEDFFNDLINKDQLIFMDDDIGVSAFMGFWRFGEKRWKFIKNCFSPDECPKQMGKGKHVYVPIIVVRPDRRGDITLKKFLNIVKEKIPDATTLSWHDTDGKFRTYKLIRREDNVCV